MTGDNLKCLCIGLFVLLCSAGLADAQEQTCSAAGPVVIAVIVTAVVTLVVTYVVYLWYKKKKRNQGKHLILEKDPEKGKDDYAFDNPGFKDAGYTPVTKVIEKNGKSETGKGKWTHWSPLGALSAKNDKRKTLDDTAIEDGEVKVVALRSHDFTGLGFNICGNMRDGIYIKDVLHRGPASESGKLNAGDRINSVTISFEHMVYEDALTILSYASPYEVILEAKGGKFVHTPGQSAQPGHPLFKSSSSTDLLHIGKSVKKRLFQVDGEPNSNYSSLQKSRSNATTLERSNSPQQKQERNKKAPPKPQLNPEQLKQQLEQRIVEDHKQHLQLKNEMPVSPELKIESETQKTENKYQKFGVKVFPEQKSQVSPKIAELSQNDNNINLERHEIVTIINEVKPPVEKPRVAPEVKKREKLNKSTEKVIEAPETEKNDAFNRDDTLNSSGIKRDANGIPQEIPSHMLNAAVAARRNRKSEEISLSIEDEAVKSPKKLKGKAPAPPESYKRSMEDLKFNFSSNNYDEIQSVEETDAPLTTSASEVISQKEEEIIIPKDEIKDYNSDSDMENDNLSSVNTIELNSSDITIHQTEENEEHQNRKTASTGDLTKIQKGRKTSTGTLERAQSLDITDTGIPSLSKKRKGGKIEDVFDAQSSDDDLYGKVLINKEPRLSLILDGLNTFQRSRLKKSTEWGNLEDAILKDNNGSYNSLEHSFTEENGSLDLSGRKFDFGAKSPEFDALVNKINEIRRETSETLENIADTMASIDSEIHENVELLQNNVVTVSNSENENKKTKNNIWPEDIFSKVNGIDFDLSSVEKPEEIDIAIMDEKKFEIMEEENPQEYVVSARFPAPRTSISIVPENATINNEKVKSAEDKTDTNINEKFVIFNKTITNLNESNNEQKTQFQIKEENKPIDESKPLDFKLIEAVTDFLAIERSLYYSGVEISNNKIDDSNISDDMKVSRHSFIYSDANQDSMELEGENDHISNVTIKSEDISKTKENNTSNVPVEKNNLEDIEHINIIEDVHKTIDIPVNNGSTVDIELTPEISTKSKFTISTRTVKTDLGLDFNPMTTYTNTHYNKTVKPLNDSFTVEVNEQEDEPSELYRTALDNTFKKEEDQYKFDNVIITTPDLIKNVTITEAIQTLNNEVTIDGPSSLTLEIPSKSLSPEHKHSIENEDELQKTDNTKTVTYSQNTIENFPNEKIEVSTKKVTVSQIPRNTSNIPKILSKSPDGRSNSSLTYITEIQVVTPNNTDESNVSEVEIVSNRSSLNKNRNLDKEFESYVKNFEANVRNFETNIKSNDITPEIKSISTKTNGPLSEKVDPEKELQKVQEIVEEQLKKLPEMRFTTSSYESSRIPEKRLSQIEALRSNFEKNIEKSPPKGPKSETTPTKSRIPIATTAKTPPMSPERRDSRNLDLEAQKDIIEMMTSTIHSTPLTTSLKYQPKTPNKNISVTSIKSNSKIPSGLPTFSGRPPVPPRKSESPDSETTVHLTGSNGNAESHFRQWVFAPTDNSVTNIVVDNKPQKQ